MKHHAKKQHVLVPTAHRSKTWWEEWRLIVVISVLGGLLWIACTGWVLVQASRMPS